MKSTPKSIKQPADWWAAFEAEAKKRNQSVAEFLGRSAFSQLPKTKQAKLSERRGVGKPRKTQGK